MQINWVLLFTYVIQIIIEIGLPVALAVWLIRKYQSTWMLIITGVAAYALSEFINTYALKGPRPFSIMARCRFLPPIGSPC